MASQAVTERLDAAAQATEWLHAYCGATRADPVRCDDAAWQIAFEELAHVADGDLAMALERARRQAEDIGTGFRIAGETDERPWPLSPVPLLIGRDEWQGIAAGIVQRSVLLEAVLADLYGDGTLATEGHIPAALVAGSPLFLRPMIGLVPPGGHHLHFVAFDLGRGPDGEWRVLADHLRAPVGAGYALENRLAMARTLGGLQARLNVERHAPFFAAFREGLAASCRRAEPRMALLTPGRYNQSYAEQAHLARYLGLLLVEGADLAVLENRLYVRTIAGLKRVDALWRRVDPRLLDPLAFDSHSSIGVPGLVDAMAADNVVVANAPGAGVLEAAAFAAFLPALAERLTGAALKLPNIATWWCGQERECAAVREGVDRLLVGPAFPVAPLGLPGGRAVQLAELAEPDRALLLADLARRPQDYVGQEVVRLSTMPVVTGGVLEARPFTLRVFAARGADGGWVVLPGGFARIGAQADDRAVVMGEGSWSADVCVHGPDPVAAVSLLPASDSIHIRRNPGTLPSRVADNFFWLGRYLERGEALLAVIRVMLGNSLGSDGGAALAPATVGKLVRLIVADGAAPAPPSLRGQDLTQLAHLALESRDWQSVRLATERARFIGEVSRERLAADVTKVLDRPFPEAGGMLERAGVLQRRFAALSGLAAEHMGRTAAWRFHDLGRRIERATAMARMLRALGGPQATSDDLSTLLDLADSQISYRQRYLTGMARVAAVDLVALDGGNPRAIAYQVHAICEHLSKLPVLDDDGMDEPQQAVAAELIALVTTASAATLDDLRLKAIEDKLATLSDAVARRYFLQGAQQLRASGLTLA